MSDFNLEVFGPAIAVLLQENRLASLGAGRPDLAKRQALEAVQNDEAFQPYKVHDAEMANACRAALWLHFDFLDESHRISQALETTEGSYWHALMHRREPDHANAAYWLRRVGQHPIHTQLVHKAAELGYLGMGMAWEPFVFNDHCEEHRGQGDATEDILRKVQRAEWELLFAYCFRQATGQAEGR